METPEKVIRALLRKILTARVDVTLLACQQRAKFEGWLKFELASELNKEVNFNQVTLEDGYATGGRSDISFVHQGKKWFIEMKTANTNWREEGLLNITRPVTRNMDGIADDIQILRRKSDLAHGLAVFCIFPIPLRLWQNTKEQIDYHLRRIEEITKLPDKILSRIGEYIEATDKFGICAYVVEVA